MKKLIFAFMIMLGMGVMSCGTGSKNSTTNDSIDSTVVYTVTVDTTAVDTIQ